MEHALITLSSVRSIDDFVIALRALKATSGPSITEITKRLHLAWQQAGIPESEWPARSTVGNCFQLGRRRPNPELLLAVVQVLCRDDPAAVSAWRRALHVVLGESSSAAAAMHVGTSLPPDPGAAIIGRDDLIAELRDAVQESDASRVIVLRGAAGVGKTALAVRLGHELVDHGLLQGPALYADLRGTTPDGRPADPRSVQEAFLQMLGCTGRPPVSGDRRMATYQQALSHEHGLMLLDDAASTEQVLQLLPRAPGMAVVITTRSSSVLRDQACDITLRPLSDVQGLAVLRRIAGADRINADHAAATQLVSRLGGLPLALALIGSHMREHPNWAVADYVQPASTLVLERGGRNAIAASEASLPGESRRLLRLLSLHPESDFDTRDAAALAECSEQAASHHLAVLAGGHLADQGPSGRYSLAPLVAAYARERLVMEEPGSRIRHAVARLGQRRASAMRGTGDKHGARPGSAQILATQRRSLIMDLSFQVKAG